MYTDIWGFPWWLRSKNLPAMQEKQEMWAQSLGLEDSHGGDHGNVIQCSCLDNPMDRGNWWAIVHRVAKSQT